MRLLVLLGLIIVVATVSASPATSFGGPGRCRCDCPSANDPVCAREGNGPKETYPSKCHLECYNCTDNRQFVVVHKGDCTKNR